MKKNNDTLLNNIGLFIKNKDHIMSNSSFFMIPVEISNFGVLGVSFRKMPIGAWLEIWTTYPQMFENCRCGGKAAIISFGGSVFSGRHQRRLFCLNCSKNLFRNNGSLSSYSIPFAAKLKKYNEFPECKTSSLDDLIVELFEYI